VAMLILVHGAGDTATVWKEVQRDLSGPSHAIDLPGRGRHPFDLSRVTVELGVQQAVSDIEELSTGPIVLVAHSIGGALSPGILADLGDRVVHLVHIAAVAAANGERPLAVASQEFVDALLADADAQRSALSGASFVDGATALPAGLRPTEDHLAVMRIDSLNFGCSPTSWAGVDPNVPRTFIHPLRDRYYAAGAQMRMAAAMQADEVIPLDVGHNVARSSPRALGAVLGEIADRYPSEGDRFS
jgi:pimeloyl-ACP methyl ester carboxylesterase